MMAAEHHFIYSGGGRDVIPREATHVSIDQSVSVIPRLLFYQHPNIVELICHAGVKRIEIKALRYCPRLRRVIIPGVEIVEACAFDGCEAITYIECPKLEMVAFRALYGCISLGNINLPSAKVVGSWAFNSCQAMTDAKFGKSLESISKAAFRRCRSLERITIPLKNGLLSSHDDDIFMECVNLKFVDLFEEEVLYETANALLLEEWRNDMNEEIDSIKKSLPNARAGDVYEGDEGEKAVVVREWIKSVLRKIIHYREEHSHALNEAASTLQLMLSNDIVMSNVLPFLELPSYGR